MKTLTPDPAFREKQRAAKLAALIGEGLTFADCVQAFKKTQDPDLDRYADAIRNSGRLSDELEVDDDVIVSKGEDGGAFVMCWAWVEDPDAED